MAPEPSAAVPGPELGQSSPSSRLLSTQSRLSTLGPGLASCGTTQTFHRLAASGGFVASQYRAAPAAAASASALRPLSGNPPAATLQRRRVSLAGGFFSDSRAVDSRASDAGCGGCAQVRQINLRRLRVRRCESAVQSGCRSAAQPTRRADTPPASKTRRQPASQSRLQPSRRSQTVRQRPRQKPACNSHQDDGIYLENKPAG